jgi:hypothetical protein
MTEKRCTKCGTVKPLTEFYGRPDRPSGTSWCRACYRERRSEYGRRPEVRKRRLERDRQPVAREKHRKRALEYNSRPEVMAHAREYNQQAEKKAYCLEYNQRPAVKVRHRRRIRKLRARLRTEVQNAYGNRCVGCGATDNLHLHHVAFNGKAHRKEIGRGDKILHWLKRHGFPPIVQLRCEDCHRRRHDSEKQHHKFIAEILAKPVSRCC